MIAECFIQNCMLPFLIPTTDYDIGVICTPLHIASYPSIQGPTIWTEAVKGAIVVPLLMIHVKVDV